MDYLDFSRNKALNNIPQKKLTEALASIENGQDDPATKTLKLIALNRYAESNIPVEYWFIKMEKDFSGDPRLMEKYKEYTEDLKTTYINGTSVCFAGNHGQGKTFTATCILKKACQKNFSCLYSDLSNIVSVLTQYNGHDKFEIRRELGLVDFLVIDEIDNRFFQKSDATNDMFASTLELVLRQRLQNKLPTLMITNSPQIKNSFTALYKSSLESLMSKIEFFVIMPGKDFRIG